MTIRFIIDNSIQRSFEQAGINTSINIFGTQSVKDSVDNDLTIARFVLFRKPYEQIKSINCILSTDKSDEACSTDEYRLHPVLQSDLLIEGTEAGEYIGKRWGAFFFRTPDLLTRLLLKKPLGLLPLGKIAHIETYLNTGGADDFFFVRLIEHNGKKALIAPTGTDDLFEIESSFLVPFIESPTEARPSIPETFEPRKYLLVIKSLDSLRNTACAKYIEWGEKQHFHLKSGTRTRSPWYVLPKQALQGASIIWPCRAGQRHVVAYNSQCIISHRFYRIHTANHPKALAAFLNSTFVAMCAEVYAGAALGQGVLDLTKPTISNIPVINLNLLSSKQLHDLEKCLDTIATEPQDSLLKQCGYNTTSNDVDAMAVTSKARLELDFMIGKLLGLSDKEVHDFRKTACRLTDGRYKKANSIE